GQSATMNAHVGDETRQRQGPRRIEFALEQQRTVGRVFRADVHTFAGSCAEGKFLRATFNSVVVDFGGLAVVGVDEMVPLVRRRTFLAPAHVFVVMSHGAESPARSVVEGK